MPSGHVPRRGVCVPLGVCVACLTACAGNGVLGAGPATSTPTTPPPLFATLTANPGGAHTPTGHGGLGVPPSVAAFCPSPQTLAPIVGELVSPDVETGTQGPTTTCGYAGSSGDTCECTVTAWSDAPSAQSDYTKLIDDVKQVGGPDADVERPG